MLYPSCTLTKAIPHPWICSARPSPAVRPHLHDLSGPMCSSAREQRIQQGHRHAGGAVTQQEPALEHCHTLQTPRLLRWECRRATLQPRCPLRAMRPRSLLARARSRNGASPPTSGQRSTEAAGGQGEGLGIDTPHPRAGHGALGAHSKPRAMRTPGLPALQGTSQP